MTFAITSFISTWAWPPSVVANLAMVKSAVAALDSHVERVHISYRKILDDTPYEPYDTSDTSEVPMGKVPPESIYPKA
jgi:hypothetical protein